MQSHLTRRLALLGAIALAQFGAVGAHAQGPAAQPGPYDFIPGERILYSEDFQATLGAASAMRRLSQATARMSIEAREGRQFLHTKPPASFVALLKDTLPERFTIDFDMYVPGPQVLRISTSDSDPKAVIDVGPHSVAASGGAVRGVSAEVNRIITDFDENRTMHYSITVNRPGVRIYIGNQRVLDAPRADVGRSNKVKFEFIGGDDPGLIDRNAPIWITDIRIAAGGNAFTYDELAAKGRIATRGILFDTGSDRIRPESAPTLKLIGDMLSSHAELKLTIEGHTDNFGSASVNHVLSDQRARSVKQYLVSNFGIAASRLATAGLGHTRPAGPNSNPTGRRLNRRVELVKQ